MRNASILPIADSLQVTFYPSANRDWAVMPGGISEFPLS